MTRMGVLDELTAITNTEMPDHPSGAFWEQLVRTCAALGDSDWTALSKPAKDWLNEGVHALKGVPGHEIVPLELPTKGDQTDPAEAESDAAAEEPTEIQPPPAPPERPKRGRPALAPGQPSKRRALSFKTGRCYYFAAHLLRREGGLGGMRAPELASEYNGSQANEKLRVSDRTASVLLYDLLATLRVLRDLDQHAHVIVAEIPKHELSQGQASP